MRKQSLVLAFVVASFPAAAEAGWTAKLTSKSTGTKAEPQISSLYFEKGLFRVDADAGTTVVMDLGAGKFVFINHKDKKHASITVDEMIKMRDQTLAQMKTQLPNLPPEVKKQVEAQIAEAEGAPNPESVPKATGKTQKINGYDCTVYAWKQGPSANEACLSSKLSVDTKEFAAATAKLSERLNKATGGKAASGMFAMLELGKHGLAVQTKSTLKQGENTVETVSEMSDIKAEKVAPAKFEVPAGYEAGDLQSVMSGSAKR